MPSRTKPLKTDPDLPPPVTKSSSKKALWEELEAANSEIHHQQARINELTDKLNAQHVYVSKLEAEVNSARKTIEVIRTIVK